MIVILFCISSLGYILYSINGVNGQPLEQPPLNFEYELGIIPDILEPILDLALSAAAGNEKITALQFFSKFRKFSFNFNDYKSRRVMRKVCKYNKKFKMRVDIAPITLSIYTIPAKKSMTNVNSLISQVNEVNALQSGTVSTIVIFYGSLLLTKDAIPLIIGDIQTVSAKIGKPSVRNVKLGIGFDKLNCHEENEQLFQMLELDLIDIVVFEERFLKKLIISPNFGQEIVSIVPCHKLLEGRNVETPISVALEFHVLLEPFRYDFSVMEFLSFHQNPLYPKTLLHMQAAIGKEEHMNVSQNIVQAINQSETLVQTRLNQGCLGLTIHFPYKQQNATLQRSSSLPLSKILVNIGNHEANSQNILSSLENIAGNLNRKDTHALQHSMINAKTDCVTLEVTFVVKSQDIGFQTNRYWVDHVLSMVKEANKINCTSVTTVIFDWRPCYRYNSCKTLNGSEEKYSNMFGDVFTVLQSTTQLHLNDKNGKYLNFGLALDRQTLLNLMPLFALSEFREKFNKLISVVLLKTSLTTNILATRGAQNASRRVTRELSQYQQIVEDIIEKPGLEILYSVTLSRCDLNVTQNMDMAEMNRFWENLDIWAIDANVTLFADNWFLPECEFHVDHKRKLTSSALRLNLSISLDIIVTQIILTLAVIFL